MTAAGRLAIAAGISAMAEAVRFATTADASGTEARRNKEEQNLVEKLRAVAAA